ncbi:MAG: dethiobiotin synthase [Verrucomicrobiota bacterium]
MNLFVSGTSTGVGKTYVTGLIAQHLVRSGHRVRPHKPICCGDREDVAHLRDAADRDDLAYDEINPLWLKTPASPLAAAWIENQELSLTSLLSPIQEAVGQAPDEWHLVEGAGGWEVPLTETETLAHLAIALAFPVLVVVDNKLGALNHTLLTVHRIQEQGLPIHGIILNQTEVSRDAASISNRVVLERVLSVPILGEILHDATELDFDPFSPSTKP